MDDVVSPNNVSVSPGVSGIVDTSTVSSSSAGGGSMNTAMDGPGNSRKWLAFLAGGLLVLLVVVGAIGAIISALKVSQPGPVAPTVPQRKPQAEEIPGETPACRLSFTVALPALTCDSLTMTPTGTVISALDKTRQFTATASGGIAPLTFTWEATASGAASGTFSPAVGRTVTWAAPDLASLANIATWEIQAVVSDSAGQVASGSACRKTLTFAPPGTLACLAVNMQPNETRVFRGGETRSLTVSASGGTGTLVYSWTVTSNGINKGTLSAVTGQTVTWTAPASFPADQTWTIAATVTDELGKTATNANCQTTLTYTAARVCGSACGSDTDCPTGLGCVGGYCRNKSCSDRADCVCVTPPTVGCNSSCTSSANCQASLACVGGYCRNPSCTDRADCVCPVTPPAPPTPPTPPTPPAPPAPPTPSPATHRECRDYACVTVSGAGADTCTSDASCRPAPTPPPIPPSGVALPTIVVLLGGAALALLGLLVL